LLHLLLARPARRAQEPVRRFSNRAPGLVQRDEQGANSSSNSAHVQSALLGSSALLLHPAADDLHVAPERGGACPHVRLHQVHHGAQRHCASASASACCASASVNPCAEGPKGQPPRTGCEDKVGPHLGQAQRLSSSCVWLLARLCCPGCLCNRDGGPQPLSSKETFLRKVPCK